MAQRWLVIGAGNVLLALVFGGIGAHLLTGTPAAAFTTAVQHQMSQGLGLLLIGLAQQHRPQRRLWRWSAWLLLGGIVGFCGGIYFKTLAGIPSLGPVVPLGGGLMMLAWLLFLIGALRGD
ncbi:MAG: DUF423 domain-containing protein [Proteobacteria bacterium]|nr:MAG: DUF423 domain-containing protein [Pseudomonadota bacterium]QKK10878.1 MAG: DUF423 domain-containing protein [Pseudomonadota bacterium]